MHSQPELYFEGARNVRMCKGGLGDLQRPSASPDASLRSSSRERVRRVRKVQNAHSQQVQEMYNIASNKLDGAVSRHCNKWV
jgi:hypothetical protein